MLRTLCLWSVLCVAGFIILALEILGIRILGPFVGTTLPVWAMLIAITLLGSVAGYYLGGLLADGVDRSTKVYGSGLSFLGGISLLYVPALAGLLTSWTPHFSFTVIAVLASLILFFLPTLFESALITFLIRREIEDMDTVGRKHGDLYGIATIGSIAGVFGTSYLLIPYLAVSQIVYALGCISIGAGLLLILRR